MKSKFTSFIPRAAMTLLVMLLTTATAWAETIDGVKYIGAYGGEQTANGIPLSRNYW